MHLLALLLIASVSAQEQDWQKYIVGPQSTVVHPKSIVSYGGSVTNPDALLPGNGADTILTRAEGEDPPYVIVDFGLNTVGFLNIYFQGASDNTPGIRLAFSETLQYLSDLSDFSRSNMANPITPGSDQIAVQAQSFNWTDTWGCKNGNQVCSDGLHGFRYLKIYLDALESDAPIVSPYGMVKIGEITLTYTAFLPTPDTFLGWFICSDEELNHLWYSGVYTNDMTTDVFRANDVDPRGAATPGLEGRLVLFDGAKRDRDPYVGDVAVAGRTAYLSHGNLSGVAARNVLADLGDHQRDDGWIPPASIFNYSLDLFDYPLWWVIAGYDYVLYTSDISYAETYWPNVVRVFEEYYTAHTNAENKLISKPDGAGDFAFVPRTGECAYYNALYILALQSAIQLGISIGNDEYSEKWNTRINEVSIAFNEAFWDESVGAYLNSNTETTSHPQDGNALAILAGIASTEQAVSALAYLDRVTSRPYGNAFMDDDSLVGGGSQRVYAFMSNFEIRARFEIGDQLPDLDLSAVDEIRRLFGWMQNHDPYVTFWEGIGGDGSMYEGPFTSAAHGWSSGVVGLLTNYIVGLQPKRPGGDSWLMDPHYSSLTFATGSIMTQTGPMESHWEKFNNDTITYQLNIPIGVEVYVNMPQEGDNWEITHNGARIYFNGEGKGTKRNDAGRLSLPKLQGGKHTIVARKL